jgi:hypothetical protein
MTSTTTKPDSLQPVADMAGDLFDNWFDPLEAEVRARSRQRIRRRQGPFLRAKRGLTGQHLGPFGGIRTTAGNSDPGNSVAAGQESYLTNLTRLPPRLTGSPFFPSRTFWSRPRGATLRHEPILQPSISHDAFDHGYVG